MTPRPVEIRGLAEFRRELRQVDRRFANEVRKIHRRVSDMVTLRAQIAARGGGRQASSAAGAIKARATNSSAYIETVKRPAYALVVFWGSKRRTGWYANRRYDASIGLQHPAWVGNQWDPGEHGGRPYFIGGAINASIPDVEDIYLEGIDDLARRAFPSN